jgi:hypothetical protein
MSSIEFLTSHFRSTLADNTFEPNVERKVVPACITPINNPVETVTMTEEEKTEEVLADPKFGMFSLLSYHWTRGYKNAPLKKRNTVYCSHIFSSLFALPALIFVTQWMMYIAVVSHQVKTYEYGFCPMTANFEEKLMMASVSLFYFIKSFSLYDDIVDRTKRKKMMPTTNYSTIIDTFQEFGFNLLVYLTNLWVIFAEQDFLNMFFNTLAMEFLMEMDNEFEKTYFSYLPGVAADIYDSTFVTHRENSIMVRQKKYNSFAFRCCRRCTWLPFKILVFVFMLLPFICFIFMLYGPICK